MIELLTSMWGYLAGAGVIGLILGWAFRGVFLPRARTINVTAPAPAALERPLTEAQQQALEKAEVDARALQAAEAKLADMERTVADLRNHVQRANQMQLAPPPPPPPAPQPTPEDEEARARAVWHERYLTSRVRYLESQVFDADTSSSDDADALKAENEALKARLESAETGTSEAPLTSAADLAKTKWQNRYLQARILFLESGTASADTETSVASSVPEDVEMELNSLKSEITVLKAEIDREAKGTGESEQEMARLRWRNRYLEGRLKYLEAASLDAEAVAETPVDIAALAAPVSPAALAKEPVEETRPESLDAPRGEADDLKRIGGIGPKIELILNELGIFHFSQITAWTPGEQAWIDSYLRFEGRVMSEKWAEQAAELQG
ncbi:hypothetical protein [Ponticaulis koreensis]|uniref:hypothetical protein n=1 Tax=Ponticaulis koreensis TaxID=1123045 RepID=UPI0003B37D72|nr:hypothetical protein [Ponticaulis koreensis]